MKECAEKSSTIAMKGCIREPLIKIEPRNCIPDELHLFIRTSDVFLSLLFTHLIRTDKNKIVILPREGTLQCGINFSVRLTESSQNSNSTSSFKFTAINRNESLIVLKRLLQCFDELISSEIAQSLAKLWIVTK
jgi:hypothetical protein